MKIAKAIGGLILTACLLAGGFSCQTGNGAKRNADSGRARLVVLSPEVAEIVAALGAESQVVGRTRESDYPSSYANCPVVGNFGAVSKERIVALKPDLVFCSALEQESLTQELRKLGLRVEQSYPSQLDDLPRMISQIGALIGRETEARALKDSLAEAISQIRHDAPAGTRPKVYLEINLNPLMSVSDASFVGDVIEAAGGDNIFGSLERDYARIDPEDVVKAKPDVIICYSQDTLANLKSRKGWQDIPAIRAGRVYFEEDIDPDWLQQATPRTLLGLRKLQDIFRSVAAE